jgi:hypothetical protein
MFEKKENIGISEVYETEIAGSRVKVSYLDLGADRIVELYVMDSTGSSAQVQPNYRFNNGSLETGCPDSDSALYRPTQLGMDASGIDALIGAFETLPADIRHAMPADYDYLRV